MHFRQYEFYSILFPRTKLALRFLQAARSRWTFVRTNWHSDERNTSGPYGVSYLSLKRPVLCKYPFVVKTFDQRNNLVVILQWHHYSGHITTEVLTTKGCLYGRNRRYQKVTHTNWLVKPEYKFLRVYEQRSSGIFVGAPVSLKYSRLSVVGTLNDEEKSKCYRMTLVGSDLRSARLSFVADTVDLFQKTLLPSFLLAGSRHASFCPPPTAALARQLRT